MGKQLAQMGERNEDSKTFPVNNITMTITMTTCSSIAFLFPDLRDGQMMTPACLGFTFTVLYYHHHIYLVHPYKDPGHFNPDVGTGLHGKYMTARVYQSAVDLITPTKLDKNANARLPQQISIGGLEMEGVFTKSIPSVKQRMAFTIL